MAWEGASELPLLKPIVQIAARVGSRPLNDLLPSGVNMLIFTGR